MFKLSRSVSISLVFFLFATSLTIKAFAQQQTPVFTPGNLVVAVSGCATPGGTCTNVPSSGNSNFINGPSGGYSDDQGAPWTLFQYSVNGATSVTYVNSLQLTQLQSGANFPISNDYGSLSEGTLQLSSDGRFLTIMGYGLNAATFNANYLLYCPGSTTETNACVPENGNPAMAQTGSLVGQSYEGNVPVPRVAAMVDSYGNVNTTTALYNIYNQNDARSAFTVNGSTMYVSGQGCKTYSTDGLCDNSSNLYDDTMGVYLAPVGGISTAPTPITGPDNGPAGCASLTTCNSSIDTRMVTVYGNTVYVSLDSKPGSATGYNRSYVGTLGTAGATSVFTCAGSGAGCPTGDGPYGPALMPGFGNTGGTGKYTMNTVGGSTPTTNGNGFNNSGLAINLAPQNFFFASPTVLYVADTGFPKNTSNGPDAVCTMDGGKSTATVGDGGLQKWILNPSSAGVTLTSAKSGGVTTWTVTGSTGMFTQGEVGLAITDTAGLIPAGTKIATVSAAGKSVTLSASATGTSSSDTVTVQGWSLAYTLYNGLNLVLNGDCNPNTPIGPGGDATTGLYGVTGTVSGGVATLYVTSYPNNDLVNSYLYGITDTLATTTMTTTASPSFTQLAMAPSDSVFRGLAMAPTLPNGSETITSTPSGLTVTTSGSNCAPGSYVTPFTLTWTAGSGCKLSVASTQTVGNTPTNPATTTYNFIKWQDGTTATTNTVAVPSTKSTYNVVFQTVPTVTFPTASSITYGETLASSTLSGGSAQVALNGTAIPGTFAFATPSTVPTVGTSNQSVLFTPTDTTDYASATGTASVTVTQVTPTVSVWPTASAITYGQMLTSSMLTGGSASVPGTFGFTAPVTTPATGTSAQGVTFTPSDNTDYSDVTGTVNVTVNPATPTVTFPTASSISYGQTLASSTLAGGSAVSGSTNVPGAFAFTAPGTTPSAGTAAQSVRFTPTDSTDYTSVTGTVSVTVAQAAASVTLTNTTQTYNGSAEAVTVMTSPSGLGISVSYTGSGSTSYPSSTTAPTNPGTYSVVAMVVDPNYAGQQSVTLTINQADPTVSLAVMSGMPTSTPYGTTVYFNLSTATAPQCPTGTAQLFVDGSASGSPVALTSTSCSQPIQFQIATLTAGQHSIYAAYTGDTYFVAENTSTLTYTVLQDATTVTLATSGSSVNVGQSVTFTATVSPMAPNNGSQAPQGTVTFSDGSSQVGTGSPLALTAPYTSSFTTSSLAAGSHSISATFTDADGNFMGSSSPVNVETVNLIVPTIQWSPNPTEFPYGTPLGSSQLNAIAVDSNGNPISGSLTYNFAPGDVLPAGTVNVIASFTPTDPSTYTSNSASVTITVDSAALTVTPDNMSISYGATLPTFTYQITGLVNNDPSSVVSGDASCSTTASSTSPVGSYPITCTLGTLTAANYTFQFVAGTLNVTQATTTVTTWPTATAINSGQSLASSTLSGGAASTAGTFAFAAPGTVPAPGTSAQSVIFTPTDTTDFSTVTGTVSVTVNKLQPTVSFTGAPSSAIYGSTFSVSSSTNATTTATISASGGCSVSGTTVTMTSGSATCLITASWSTDANYLAASATQSTAAVRATTTVIWATPTAITYGTALGGTQQNAKAQYNGASVSGTYAYTPAKGTVLAVGAQTLSVNFTPGYSSEYTSASGSVTLQVNQATPKITWTEPAAIPYGTALSSTQLDATTTVPGTFVYSPVAGTVLTAGSHSLSVTFTPTDTTDYATVTATTLVSVSKGTPSITWSTPAAISYGTALSSVQLDASTSLPGKFTYSPAAGAIPAVGAQTLTATFTPTDTADYSTLKTSVTLQVNIATPTITWATPVPITYGTALSATQLNAKATNKGSVVSGTFAYTPAAGTVPGLGTQTLSVVFTPSNTSEYNSANASVTLQVNQGSPKITWPTPASITYGTALSATQLDATTTVPGTFVYSPAAGAVPAAGNQTLSVIFTPTDTTTYSTITATTTLGVSKVKPSITWPTPPSISYGTALSSTQLNATSSVAGTFVYSPAAGTVLSGGTKTLSVTFTPNDTTDYYNQTATVTLQVTTATPTLTWATPAAVTYGTALGGTQQNASAQYNGATVSGTYAYTPAKGTVLGAGEQTLSVVFTPAYTSEYSSTSGSVTLQVKQATPKITWAKPTAIPYGTALSSTQLDATTTVPGTFVYSPAAGSVPNAGTQTLSVTFTPTDTTDYATVTATTTISVQQ